MPPIRLPLAPVHASTRRRFIWLAWLPALLALLAACGDDATGPGRTDVAGAYTATTFIVTSGGTTTDVLAEGGSLDIVLNEDGTTTGHLFVPGADEGGADLDVALDGNWTITGNTVHFTQSEDTFVRDLPFTADGSTLRADASVPAGVRIQVTLAKGPIAGT